MPRRGQVTAGAIGPFPGDTSDRRGFPVMWADFETWMAARGYSPATIRTRRHATAQLAAWLAERGITRPAEVTREMLERYQRHLFFYRKPDGQPLLTAIPGRPADRDPAAVRLGRLPPPDPGRPRRRAGTAPPAPPAAPPGPVRRRGRGRPGSAGPVLAARPAGPGHPGSLLRHRHPPPRADPPARWPTSTTRRCTVLIRAGKGAAGPAAAARRAGPGRGSPATWPTHDRVLCRDPAVTALFVASDGGPISKVRVGQLAHGYIAASGTGKTGACHLFRHTMATLMLDGGADLRYVQEMLGHASVATTQIYTHVSITALQAVHARTHPGTRTHPPDREAPS